MQPLVKPAVFSVMASKPMNLAFAAAPLSIPQNLQPALSHLAQQREGERWSIRSVAPHNGFVAYVQHASRPAPEVVIASPYGNVYLNPQSLEVNAVYDDNGGLLNVSEASGQQVFHQTLDWLTQNAPQLNESARLR